MRIIYCGLFCTLTMYGAVHAQDSTRKAHVADSIKKAVIADLMIKNPTLRPVILSTSFIAGSQLRGDFKGSKFFDGDFYERRTEALITVPVKIWKKNVITATVTYMNTTYHVSDVKGDVDIKDQSLNKGTLGVTLTYRTSDSLFGRPVYYSVSVTGLSGDMQSINKYAVMANAMLALKQTREESLLVGAMVIADPTSSVPMIPLLTYTKQLQHGYDINITMPQQVRLRKAFSDRWWGSLGTFMSSSISFFNYDAPDVPRNANFSTLELRTGPGLEHRLTKAFVIGVNAGLWTPLIYRQYSRWDKNNHYFFNGKIQSTPYINFNLSLLPF